MTTEDIERAFADEYERLQQNGIEGVLTQRLDVLLFLLYRRGYVRGHGDRSREVQRAEEQAIQEGRGSPGLSVRYDHDRLILSGRDMTPSRETAS